MKSQEEIHDFHSSKKKAIFERFENQNSEIEKSEDVYWTESDLVRFKDDLVKSVDEGNATQEDLSKAIEEIKSLKKETREIEGEQVTVFVR